MLTVKTIDYRQYFLAFHLDSQYNDVVGVPTLMIPLIESSPTTLFESRGILNQGTTRSPYNGATDVEQLALSGELNVFWWPERAESLRKHIAEYGESLADLRWSNGLLDSYPRLIDPYGSGDPDDPWIGAASAIDAVLYDPGYGSSYPHGLFPKWQRKIIPFGFADKGDYSYQIKRTWTQDVTTLHYKWELRRHRSELVIQADWHYWSPTDYWAGDQSDFDKPKSIGPSEGTGSQTFTINLSELSDILTKAVLPSNYQFHWRALKTGAFTTTGEIVTRHRADETVWARCDRRINYLCTIASILEDSTSVNDTTLLPNRMVSNLDSICREIERYYDWRIGESRTVVSFDPGDNYNLPCHKGEDRGGTTIWGDLQETAIENNRLVTMNPFTFFLDLIEMKDTVESLGSAFKADALLVDQAVGPNYRKGCKVKTSKLPGGVFWQKLAKNGANTYLPIKYGYGLTLAEAKQIGEGVARCISDVRLASEVRDLGPASLYLEDRYESTRLAFFGRSKWTWHAVVKPQPNSFSEVFAFLDERSLFIKPTDLWDYVPYSFCVDWFTNAFSDALARADFATFEANYNLLQVQRSVKAEFSLSAWSLLASTGWYCTGDSQITGKYYKRAWNSKFEAPSLFTTKSGKFTHQVEASALLIQRFMR